MEEQHAVTALRADLVAHIKEKFVTGAGIGTAAGGKTVNWKAVEFIFEEMINDLVHKNVLENDRRPDGRKLD